MIYKKILFKDFLPYEYVINKEKINKKRDINMIKILLLLSLLLLPYTYEVVNSNDYSSQNEVFVEDKAKCKVDFNKLCSLEKYITYGEYSNKDITLELKGEDNLKSIMKIEDVYSIEKIKGDEYKIKIK